MTAVGSESTGLRPAMPLSSGFPPVTVDTGRPGRSSAECLAACSCCREPKTGEPSVHGVAIGDQRARTARLRESLDHAVGPGDRTRDKVAAMAAAMAAAARAVVVGQPNQSTAAAPKAVPKLPPMK